MPKALAERATRPRFSGSLRPSRTAIRFASAAGGLVCTKLGAMASLPSRTDVDRLLVYIQGRYAKQDGSRSENEIFGGMDLEVDLSDRWFVFGKTYLEFDEFENLDLRARATAGMGYFLIRQDHQELKLRAGVGFQHESFDDGTSENDGVLTHQVQ